MLLCRNPQKLFPQIVGTFIASTGYLILGAVRGWTSPGLPSLFESGALPDLDRSIDEAWIASCPQLCAVAGALLVSWPLQKFGRKWTMVAMSIPWTLGFLLIGFAENKGMIYAGRVLGGLMEGTIAPSAQVYITEISSPRVRGVLGSATAVNLSVGTLIAYIIGAYVPWDVLSFILITFPVFFAISMACLPESPAWLLTQGRDLEAKKALQYYRGRHTDVEEEFKRTRENVEKMMNLQQSATMGDFFRGPVLKPLFISMALMFFQQFCGVNAVLFYTVKIFAMAGSSVDKHTATIIIGAVLLVCAIVSAYVVDISGRRMLLFVSGFLMALSLFAMGTFFYMKDLWGDKEAEASLGWLPLASLVVFIVGFSAGFGSVPFIIMGELFPLRFRHILSPISSSFFVLNAFIIVRTFPDLSSGLHLYGAFWFYACWSVVAVVFVYFCLPETKGKTLEEIEDLFDPDAARMKEFALTKQRSERRRSSIQPELATPRRGSITLVASVAAAAAAAAMAAQKAPV